MNDRRKNNKKSYIYRFTGIYPAFVLLIFTVGLSFLTHSYTAAQQISVLARLDSNEIMIGDQVTLVLEITQDKKIKSWFPAPGDTIIKQIEILSKSPIDTIQSGALLTLRQSWLITSFDSGQYVIPPFNIPFELDTLKDTIQTNPLSLLVHSVKIDTTKQAIFDIKKPFDAPLLFKEILPYLIWGFAIAIIIFAAIYIYIRRKKKQPLLKIMTKPQEPPHIIAYRELDRIRQEKLWQQNRVKEYHTQVTDVIRTYIERRYNVMAMEQTSDEILKGIVYLVNQQVYDMLRQMLTLADLVKFAKMFPLPDENDHSLRNAYGIIDQTRLISEIPAAGPDQPKETVLSEPVPAEPIINRENESIKKETT